jgi:hypothetical protein
MIKLTREKIWEIWHSSPKDGAVTVSEFARAIEAEVLRINGAGGEWHDVKEDQWTPEIEAAHPLRSKNYKAYETALEMVGNRRSKGALVKLVCWLLQTDGESWLTEKPSADGTDLVPRDDLFVCAQMGASVTRVYVEPRATGCPDTMDETAEIAVASKQAGEEKSPPATGPAG